MTMPLTNTEQIREQLTAWCNSPAAQRVMDTRSKEQFEQQQQLLYSVSIPYNELDIHWSELPSRNSPFALLLPIQERNVDENESVLYKLRVRGWMPTIVLWDQPLLWSVATSMGLVVRHTDIATRSIQFLFTPCPFLEEQIPRIERLLVESALKKANNLNTNVLVRPSLFFQLCDVGCGSGRDVAWMLARSSKSHIHSDSYIYWKAHAIDAWQGAVKRTCQLLASRHFTMERVRVIRAQFQSSGNIRYYDAALPFSSTSEASVNSSLLVKDQQSAKQLMETSTYDLVIVVRFLERATFPRLDNWVAPGGFILYSTFVDGICDYEQPAGQEHRLAIGELANYFGKLRGYTILEDRIDSTEDGRPLNSFLARKLDNTE